MFSPGQVNHSGRPTQSIRPLLIVKLNQTTANTFKKVSAKSTRPQETGIRSRFPSTSAVTSTLRLLIISDVGGAESRHLGDEAMLEGNLAALRRLISGVALTVVSRDPAWTAARYGVGAVAPFGFSRNQSAGAERD